MTGMRSHTDHQSRLDWWRRQIQRQPKTDLTIADFCRQLGVSVPTFYSAGMKVGQAFQPDVPEMSGWTAIWRSTTTRPSGRCGFVRFEERIGYSQEVIRGARRRRFV